jgi:hypothetical protein
MSVFGWSIGNGVVRPFPPLNRISPVMSEGLI